jgi:hypothetical protein
MQGKTCFNFKWRDDKLFAELDQLTGNEHHCLPQRWIHRQLNWRNRRA